MDRYKGFREFLKSINGSASRLSINVPKLGVNSVFTQQALADMGVGETLKRLRSLEAYRVSERLQAARPNLDMYDFSSAYPWLKAVKAITGPIALVGLAYNTEILKQLRLVSDPSSRNKWIEEQKNSLLFNYFASHVSEAVDGFYEVQEGLEVGILDIDADEWVDLPKVKPEIEKEILDFVGSGGSWSGLSSKAKKYWAQLVAAFVGLLWVLNQTSAVIANYEWVESKISKTSSSKEVRSAVSSLSPENRRVMEGLAVVTGDQVIVRASPSASSSELGRVGRKTFVEVLADSKENWVHVSVEIDDESVTGWIARRYIIDF